MAASWAGSIQDRFDRQAELAPEAVALVVAGRSISYRELAEMSNGVANFLIQEGVSTSTPVALNLGAPLQELVSLLGVLKAGGAYLPLPSVGPAHRSARMITDASCRLVLGNASPLELPTTAKLIDTHSLKQIEPARIGPGVASDPDDLVYILFTSGSTGRPKGVAMRHGALANLVGWQISSHGFGKNDRVLKFSTTQFDVSAQEVFSAWLSGACLVVAEEKAQRDPDLLLRQLRDSRITRLFLPFVALRQLAQTAVLRHVFPETLREVYTAGEQLYVTTDIREFFTATGAALHNQYGPTETHVVTAYKLPGSPEAWLERPPIGYPIPGAIIEVIGENGEALPLGEVGELGITGEVLARGYVGMPELTAERFVTLSTGQRMYLTGDLGRVNGAGAIEFVGRADRQIKVRGYRVEPGEIEKTLLRHPAVSETVVEARSAPSGGQEMVAWIVRRTGAELNENSVREYCSDYLPDYMVPPIISFVEEMPLTGTGKVDRQSLIDQNSPQPPGAGSPTELEKTVIKVITAVLAVPAVDIDENFFDLGGHSVTAVTVALELSRIFEMDIHADEVFDSPTIRDLIIRVGRIVDPGDR